MSNIEMNQYIREAMNVIDEILDVKNIPIYDRFLIASRMFVSDFIEDTSYSSKAEFLKSDAFFECIVPVVHDWYFEKYGELATSPHESVFSAAITIRNQPILIKFPATISIVEKEGETAWIKFVDHLDKSEDMQAMLQGRNISLDSLSRNQKCKVEQRIEEVVACIRTISINLTALKVDSKTVNLARTILDELERASLDLTSYDKNRIANSCWHTHLAIEKTMKVFLKQNIGQFEETHNLKSLLSKTLECSESKSLNINFSVIDSFPQNVVALRYGEESISAEKALLFYNKALPLIRDVSSVLVRSLGIRNASILFKKPAWVK
ncbi:MULTISPECIES: HEPN domain-containing protein [Vibrio]|uniref:HEPN domain-containing protein n=1 Tax=Vibrio TaxID=662 RepID=UPI001B300F28|nr:MULTISPECIES: HEPN domain-containing protein [Vibrio]MCG9629963.1 HEPN domain-containing protein [Vibrio sp. Isolate30]